MHLYPDRDIKRLAEVMNLLLDTPSKRILWRYVIPRLSPAHQGVVRKTLDIPDSHSGKHIVLVKFNPCSPRMFSFGFRTVVQIFIMHDGKFIFIFIWDFLECF